MHFRADERKSPARWRRATNIGRQRNHGWIRSSCSVVSWRQQINLICCRQELRGQLRHSRSIRRGNSSCDDRFGNVANHVEPFFRSKAFTIVITRLATPQLLAKVGFNPASSRFPPLLLRCTSGGGTYTSRSTFSLSRVAAARPMSVHPRYHRFNPACQFSTTEIRGFSPAARSLTRNRLPFAAGL